MAKNVPTMYELWQDTQTIMPYSEWLKTPLAQTLAEKSQGSFTSGDCGDDVAAIPYESATVSVEIVDVIDARGLDDDYYNPDVDDELRSEVAALAHLTTMAMDVIEDVLGHINRIHERIAAINAKVQDVASDVPPKKPYTPPPTVDSDVPVVSHEITINKHIPYAVRNRVQHGAAIVYSIDYKDQQVIVGWPDKGMHMEVPLAEFNTVCKPWPL